MKYIFFLNMGGVNKLDECELFLKNMFADEAILPIKNTFLRKILAFFIIKARLKKMKENYTKIGGKSPLSSITKKLCAKLNSENSGLCFDFISLYVPPFSKSVFEKYEFKKEDELIFFPLYPHFSTTTVKSSLKEALNSLKAFTAIKPKCIDIFYEDEAYNELICEHILEAKLSFLPQQKKLLLISAHSLPLSIIEKGDPYEEQIKKHFEIIKEKLKDNFSDILLAYQSKLGPVKWLGPSTAKSLEELENEALIYPISFCIDCSESVFELNIEYRDKSKKEYFVVACPNDSLAFRNFIIKKIKELS